MPKLFAERSNDHLNEVRDKSLFSRTIQYDVERMFGKPVMLPLTHLSPRLDVHRTGFRVRAPSLYYTSLL
jgi:hypothetical protein